MPTLREIMTMDRALLKKFKRSQDFKVEPDTMGADQRITIHAWPIPGHQYAAGTDSAFGIEGRDYDAMTIADKSTDPVETVAELEGRWGSDRFDRIVYAMLRLFNNAFLVGERQGSGLVILRSLVNNFEYGYLYYDRNEVTKGRRRMDVLGHNRTHDDLAMARARAAVRENRYIIRSERGRQQMMAYQFRPKRKGSEKTEDMRDSDLVMGAPSGEFDDILLSQVYAWTGIEEIHLFQDEKPIYEDGTAGQLLGHADVLAPKPKHEQPKSPFRKAGK